MNTKNMVEYNIKLYREKKGLSQVELSRLIGKNKKFITNLENGKYTKAENLKILVSISKIFQFFLFLPNEFLHPLFFENLENLYFWF